MASIGNGYFPAAYSQKSNLPKQMETSSSTPLTAAITIYGINGRTGNMLTFIDFGDLTKATYYNASAADLSDKGKKDGIIQVFLQVPAKKITPGMEFNACTLVLKDPQLLCNKGHVSPYQTTSLVDLALNNTK